MGEAPYEADYRRELERREKLNGKLPGPEGFAGELFDPEAFDLEPEWHTDADGRTTITGASLVRRRDGGGGGEAGRREGGQGEGGRGEAGRRESGGYRQASLC